MNKSDDLLERIKDKVFNLIDDLTLKTEKLEKIQSKIKEYEEKIKLYEKILREKGEIIISPEDINLS